jgi:hypothetical protein
MSVTTALDLIKGALRLDRVLGTGDVLSDEDAQVGLDQLNMLLESWSLDHLYIYVETQVHFPFVAQQGKYTVGPGGDFNLPERPLKIYSAFTRANGFDYPMSILTDATQYDSILNKQIVVMYPSYVWYEQTFPLGTLWFYPVPNGNEVYLRFWQGLSSFTSLTDPLAFPKGYSQAIMYNLAVLLSGPFGIEVPATVVAGAASSVRRLRRYNFKSTALTVEATYMNRRTNRYNINSDSLY